MPYNFHAYSHYYEGYSIITAYVISTTITQLLSRLILYIRYIVFIIIIPSILTYTLTNTLTASIFIYTSSAYTIPTVLPPSHINLGYNPSLLSLPLPPSLPLLFTYSVV